MRSATEKGRTLEHSKMEGLQRDRVVDGPWHPGRADAGVLHKAEFAVDAGRHSLRCLETAADLANSNWTWAEQKGDIYRLGSLHFAT